MTGILPPSAGGLGFPGAPETVGSSFFLMNGSISATSARVLFLRASRALTSLGDMSKQAFNRTTALLIKASIIKLLACIVP